MTGEAEKYIGQANLFIKTGNLSAPSLWMYFTQITLLSFCIKLHLSFAIAIAVQFFFNFLATWYFHRTLYLVFNSSIIALVGVLLLLLNQSYQEFNVSLQTESLFYSFTLIASCYIITIEKLSFKNISGMIFLLALISLTRPTGLLFIPPALIYLFFIYLKQFNAMKKLAILSLVGIAFLFLLNQALGSGGELDFMLPFRDERIICGVPTLPGFLAIKTTSNGNSLWGLLYYITHNFSQFIRLAFLRTLAFFGLWRNYFGIMHNVFLVIYFYSIHMLAILSLPYWANKNAYRLLYFLALIFLTWLTVILTCDDWHNRFYLSISPYIIFLSLGFASMRIKKATNDQQ